MNATNDPQYNSSITTASSTTNAPFLAPEAIDIISASLGVTFNVGTIFWFSYLPIKQLLSPQTRHDFTQQSRGNQLITALRIFLYTAIAWQASDPYKKVAQDIWSNQLALGYIEQLFYTPSHYSGTAIVLDRLYSFIKQRSRHWRIALLPNKQSLDAASAKTRHSIETKVTRALKNVINHIEQQYRKNDTQLPTLKNASSPQTLLIKLLNEHHINSANSSRTKRKAIITAFTLTKIPLLSASMIPFFVDSTGTDFLGVCNGAITILANMGLIMIMANDSSKNVAAMILDGKLPICLQSTPESRKNKTAYWTKTLLAAPILIGSLLVLGYLTGKGSQDLFEKNTAPYITNPLIIDITRYLLRIGTTLFNIFGIGSIILTAINACYSKKEPLHLYRQYTEILLLSVPKLIKSDPGFILDHFSQALAMQEHALLENQFSLDSSAYGHIKTASEEAVCNQVIHQVSPFLFTVAAKMLISERIPHAEIDAIQACCYLSFLILQLPISHTIRSWLRSSPTPYDYEAPHPLATEDPLLQTLMFSYPPVRAASALTSTTRPRNTVQASQWLTGIAKGLLIAGLGYGSELLATVMLGSVTISLNSQSILSDVIGTTVALTLSGAMS